MGRTKSWKFSFKCTNYESTRERLERTLGFVDLYGKPRAEMLTMRKHYRKQAMKALLKRPSKREKHKRQTNAELAQRMEDTLLKGEP